METNRQTEKVIEGLILVIVGLFVFSFGILKYVPETENTIYKQVTIFNILQVLLAVSILVIGIRCYKPAMRHIDEFAIGHLGNEYPQIQNKLLILFRMIDFFLLIIAYNLVVPETRIIFTNAGIGQQRIILILNIFFIVFGLSILIRIWQSVQKVVSEAVKNKPGNS